MVADQLLASWNDTPTVRAVTDVVAPSHGREPADVRRPEDRVVAGIPRPPTEEPIVDPLLGPSCRPRRVTGPPGGQPGGSTPNAASMSDSSQYWRSATMWSPENSATVTPLSVRASPVASTTTSSTVSTPVWVSVASHSA